MSVRTEPEMRQTMAEMHVSPGIIDRIVRLNPNALEGDRLRGWHYKRFYEPYAWGDMIGKGAFIRKYGRAVFAELPKTELLKSGRRVYVTRKAMRRLGSDCA